MHANPIVLLTRSSQQRGDDFPNHTTDNALAKPAVLSAFYGYLTHISNFKNILFNPVRST
jgi:hypothetical protein